MSKQSHRIMQHHFSKQPASPAGYTLIEVLVVVIMVGVLAAIVSPSYVAWANNQRVGSARNQLTSAIRKAQSLARTSKVNREIRFDNNNGDPRFAIVPAINDTTGVAKRIPNAQIRNWEPLNTDGKAGLELRMDTVSPYQSSGVVDNQNLGGLVFNSYGAVVVSNPNTTLGTANTISERIFAVQISTKGNQHKSCIVIRTLLGSLQEEKGKDCPF
ncbi:prepilin-type N-terminal cleavage/methylation domain-containing protein [filamentous cyanobacterium LEGE 11480]|uniref:Prepilin-type N-terminal cleavage/methylation domain-containing protein n=1 Tax=Romeriopsis navalis LEGE 11480 TaxID=2777977 RepID=A0A928VIH7_9CYAN|nr:prepilin-type N-terminal cleavage/methylation domain-containing protein [Romeriopsis navalis]MBE9029233.1 prepilin-type N-terminal cleavage/methylation domain-containing protein [Romeriopsis navalis LEGE 11480]